MAEPVLTPELLAAYREVVAASDADAKLPPHKRSNRLGDALANVYGIVGSASLIVHLADEVARLTRERDEARRMLGECYILSGADPDGNAPDSPHLWPYAVPEVRRLREEYDELLIEGAQAEAEERARCVAHLRALADIECGEEAIQVLLDAADDIECGEHVEEVAGG